jgi:hypothetical protein
METENSGTNITVQNASLAAPKGRLIKRTEAARMLNMSVSSLRRYEHELQPIIGPNGVHLFDEVVIRSAGVTLRHRRTISSMGPPQATSPRTCSRSSTMVPIP